MRCWKTTERRIVQEKLLIIRTGHLSDRVDYKRMITAPNFTDSALTDSSVNLFFYGVDNLESSLIWDFQFLLMQNSTRNGPFRADKEMNSGKTQTLLSGKTNDTVAPKVWIGLKVKATKKSRCPDRFDQFKAPIIFFVLVNDELWNLHSTGLSKAMPKRNKPAGECGRALCRKLLAAPKIQG